MVSDRGDPCLTRTIGAAIKNSVCFHTMADYSASTMVAYWGELVYSAFEAVKRMGVTGRENLERAIVVIAADITFSHGTPSANSLIGC